MAGESDEVLDPRARLFAEGRRRWAIVKAFLRTLRTVEQPIFPGPVPDRRAPRMARGLVPQLDPVRPLPGAAHRDGRWGASGGRPQEAGAPRACLLYKRNYPLRAPTRRRRAADDAKRRASASL